MNETIEAKQLRVKKSIRSLLVSSKHGCTPKQLYSDYEHIVGETLPYKSFGYNTFMEYITSMPDVVEVRFSKDCSTVLYGVADSSTQHIARMVSKQRSKPPVRNNQLKRYASSLELSRYGGRPEPKVPLAFITQTKTLLLSYSNGLPLLDFPEAFARRFGYYLSFKMWGFSSLEQVFKAISGLFTCDYDPTRKCHVVRRAPALPQVNRPIVMKVTGGEDTGSGTATPQEGSQLCSGGQSQGRPKSIPQKIPLPSPSSNPQNSLHSLELSPKKTQSFLEELRSPPPRSQRRPMVPRDMLGKIQKLLKFNPAGIWVSRFPVEFQHYFGEPLPTSSLGFTSMVHLLSSLSTICDLERPSGTGDWLAFAKGTNQAKAVHSHPCVSAELVKSIHLLLRAHPGGVPLSRLSRVFENTIHSDLPVEELGFSSVAELLGNVHGTKMVRLQAAGPVMVVLSEEGGEEERNGENTTGEYENTASSEPPTSTPAPPPQRRPSSYQLQPLPLDKKMITVYVTNVKTPSCMNVQLIGENTTKALEYLLEDITEFYNSKAGSTYKMKAGEMQLGQPCCTVYSNDGYWYRAELTGLPTSDIAEVMYVDYGNSGQVPRGSLRRPKPHYLALPAQAIKCRLANVKPAGSTWSRRATSVLFQMTRDKPIVAIITSVKHNWVSVCLCDTTTDRDIHVNDTLVSQGLALFSPDTDGGEASYDAFQLEPLPQGSTGDKVPEVRPPTGPSKLEVAVSSIVATPLPPTPTLGSPHYLQQVQQLLLLQQQQNALLLRQPSLLPQGTPLAATCSVQAGTSPKAGVSRQTSGGNPPRVVPSSQQSTNSITSQPSAAASSGQPSPPQGLPEACIALPATSSCTSTAPSSRRVTCPQREIAPVQPLPHSLQPSLQPLPQPLQPLPQRLQPPPLPLQPLPQRLQPLPQPLQPSPQPLQPSPQPLRPLPQPLQPPPQPPGLSSKAAGVVLSRDSKPSSPPSLAEPSASGAAAVESGAGESVPRVPGKRVPARSDAARERPEKPKELLLVKKVTLTPSHYFHVLRHNNRAHVISAEVSLWFWDSDLLQAMLRQVQKPLWGLLVRRERAPRLWDAMRQTKLSELLRGTRDITVYSLEDLPGIISMFHGPRDLCTAVRKEAGLWETQGLDYFSPRPAKNHSEMETERLGAALKDLQLKRHDLLVSMMQRSDDDPASGKASLERLIEVEKNITDIKSSLSKLKSPSTLSQPSQSQPEPSQSQTKSSQPQTKSSQFHAEPAQSQTKPSQAQAESFYFHTEPSQSQTMPFQPQTMHAKPSQSQTEYNGELQEAAAVAVVRDPSPRGSAHPQQALAPPLQSLQLSDTISNSCGSLSSADEQLAPPITLPSTTALGATLPNTITLPPNLTSTITVPPNLTSATAVHPNLPSTTAVHPNLTSTTAVHPNLPSTITVSPNLTSTTAVHPNLTSTTAVHPNLPSTITVPPNLTSTTAVHPNLAWNTATSPVVSTLISNSSTGSNTPFQPSAVDTGPLQYPSLNSCTSQTGSCTSQTGSCTSQTGSAHLPFPAVPIPVSAPMCSVLPNHLSMPYDSATSLMITLSHSLSNSSYSTALSMAKPPPSLANGNTVSLATQPPSLSDPFSVAVQSPSLSSSCGFISSFPAAGNTQTASTALPCPQPISSVRLYANKPSVPIGLGRGRPLRARGTESQPSAHAALYNPTLRSTAPVNLVSWPAGQPPVPCPGSPAPPTTTAVNLSYSSVARVTTGVSMSPSSKHIGLGRGASRGGGAHTTVGLGRGTAPPKEAWQHVHYSRKLKPNGNVAFPPIGSGAGLDVI